MNKHAMFPSFSVDDRWVAYVSKDGGQWDIYAHDLWKSQTIKVTNDKNIEFTPVFHPNGSLYFTRFEADELNQKIDIFKIPAEEVLNPKGLKQPRPFLADKNAAEYVPSFSNPHGLELTSGPSFMDPERSSFGSVIHNGNIYIAGGHQGPEHTYPKESFLDRVEVFEEVTRKWRSLAPMKLAKHGFQMVAHDNYIYVFGGFTFSEIHDPKWKSVDTIERYNIKTDTWEILPQKLSVPRSSNAIAHIGDKVYLLGGWNSTPKFKGDKDGKFLEVVDVFDLTTETLVPTHLKMPKPLRRAFTAVVKHGEIYMLGGIGEGASHFDWIDNLTLMNPNTGKVRELAPLPFATFAPGAGFIDDNLYLIGGMVLHNKATYDLDYVDDIYRFDGQSKKWAHTGVYLGQNKGFPQVVPIQGHGLGILGGHTYQFTNQGVVDHPVKSFEILKYK